MKKIIIFLFLLLLVFSLIGCSGSSTCGNDLLDNGEQCDNSECSSGEWCNEQCECEALPPVPALPGE